MLKTRVIPCLDVKDAMPLYQATARTGRIMEAAEALILRKLRC